MTRSVIPSALHELQNPSSHESQVDALRKLKNEIVGHDHRKELAVRHGIVAPLAEVLHAEARKSGKNRWGAKNGTCNGTSTRETERGLGWSSEDELRFQAILIVGSLANGGPAFVAPLLAGNILPPLFDALSPSETPPKLVLAALRSLNQIVDFTQQEEPWQNPDTGSPSLLSIVSQHMYTDTVLERLADILAQVSRSIMVQQEISLVAQLVEKTCQEEPQRKMLVDGRILEQLAARLSNIADMDVQAFGYAPPRPQETPPAYLPELLEAIAAIITDSNYNTARFLYADPLQQLFGPNEDASDESSSWAKLLPRLKSLQPRSDSYGKSWPALGSFQGGSPEAPPPQRMPNVIVDDAEAPLFSWLMYVARKNEGRTRLAACRLLARLKSFSEKWPLNDPSRLTRERHFAFLIVPIVVKMIESDRVGAPVVLAELVAGSKALQNAAMDCKVLPTLVQQLKKSFDPVPVIEKQLWIPKEYAMTEEGSHDRSSVLGRPGLSTYVNDAFKARESALLALATLADTQDSLRKQIMDAGAATHIKESLIPLASTPEALGAVSLAQMKSGNPAPVLIAACKAVRSLSRSVSVLRTDLIDCGVALPVVDLLTSADVKVQIAATEVITNLVLDMSPMRAEIIGVGAIKTLCEHCRSTNFELRLASLWALKHICLQLPCPDKVACLDELGVDWLVQTLGGRSSKPPTPAPSFGMSSSNAAGEQVDILNAMEEPHMDVDDEPVSEDDDAMTEDPPSARRHQRTGSRYITPSSIRSRLQQIKNEEQEPRVAKERNEIRMQEQALDFVRNFINEGRSSGDMIDHIVKTFGQARFFELLDSKIRPKGSPPSSPPDLFNPSTHQRFPHFPPANSGSPMGIPSANPNLAQSTNWSLYYPPEILAATMYILVHLANGLPAHRNLLIQQKALMRHIIALCSHPSHRVRTPCIWFINNLTWVDDGAQEGPARERAVVLRQMGYDVVVKFMQVDEQADIRERAKVGLDQFARLLDRDGASRGDAGTGLFLGRGLYGGGAGTGEGAGAGSGGGLGRVGQRGWHRDI